MIMAVCTIILEVYHHFYHRAELSEAQAPEMLCFNQGEEKQRVCLPPERALCAEQGGLSPVLCSAPPAKHLCRALPQGGLQVSVLSCSHWVWCWGEEDAAPFPPKHGAANLSSRVWCF